MADQATVSNGRRTAKQFGRNVSGYAHDVVTLTELQLRLLAVDLRDGSKTAGLAVAAIVVGVLAALGAIPLVFVTIALALVEFGGWSYTAAFALSALSGLVVGALALYFGWKRLLSAGRTLGRSKAELVQTLKWIKESLRPSDVESDSPPVSSRF